MKILFCIPSLDHGGAERQLTYLAAELARMGHDVHVAAARGPNLDRLKSSGVIWHSLGWHTKQDGSILFRLTRFIRIIAIWFRLVVLIQKLKPDVVQSILAPMDVLVGAATRLTGTPWILKESSCAALYDALYGTDLKVWIRSFLGRMSNAIVSNSMGGHDYWHSALVGRPLHIIPNALSWDEMNNAGSDSIHFAVERNEKVVLCAGRIDLGKNVENVIIALASIADDVAFTAVICGDGNRRQHAERLARGLGIAHRIFFTGYIDDLWAFLKRADVLVSLSLFEGCPNVVLEAMACGCPLVVSDIPAHREILDESSASFVNPFRPTTAAEAIKFALTDGASARERASFAQAKVAGFTIEHTARLYERLYLDVSSPTEARDRFQTTTGDDGEWKLSAN